MVLCCAMCYTKIDVDKEIKNYYHILYRKEVIKVSGTINKIPYGTNGVIEFSRLWELMERKGYNKQWLKNNGIHSNTIAKLTKNENVTCEVLANLCNLLNCQPWEIMEYKRKENT